MTTLGLWDFVTSPVVLAVLGVAAALAWPVSRTFGWPRLVGSLFVVSVGVIVALTLTPGPGGAGMEPAVPHFLQQLHDPRTLAAEFFSLPSDTEQRANILLYVPTGFLGWFVWRGWLHSALVGFALTTSIETLQILVGGRAGSVTDIRNNTVGAVAGALVAAVVLHATRDLARAGRRP